MESGISVICTLYNDQDEINNLLNDIAGQSLKPSEIVIADGGSTDKTLDIINKFKKHCNININLIFGKRLNISQGLNEAIKNSKNDIIIIMSTGNRYNEKFIEELMRTKEYNNSDIVYAPIRGCEKNSFSSLYCKTFLNDTKGSRIPSNHGVLIKKEIFSKIGLFYENFIYAGEDEEFFNRATNYNLNIYCSDNALLSWDVPNNLESFRKQVKGYTIAKMQIESFSLLKKYWKMYFLLLLIIWLVIVKNLYFSVIFMLFILLYIVYKIIRGSLKQFLLKLYRTIFELWIIMTNYKKFNKKYIVDINKIERL